MYRNTVTEVMWEMGANLKSPGTKWK